MAFEDNPIVDNNSVKSEESVLEVQRLLSRKNGFISRIEYPDYGVDLDVELLINNNATSRKFAVQIKSTSELKFVIKDGSKFISINFKTSRLGYLCRRLPALGIITIYDDLSRLTYFDYVDDIIKRLDEHGKGNWREKETVNIKIPLNILNEDIVKSLHSRMNARHENHELLITSQGEKYNIPSYLTSNSNKIDFNDTSQIIKYLEKFGSTLFNEQKFNTIAILLSKLSNNEILQSDELIFLSAIVFGNTGNVIDADYYIDRFYRRSKPPLESEVEVVEYARIKIEFLKGNIDYPNFLESLTKLKNSSKTESNILNLEINILYIELIKTIEKRQFDDSIEEAMELLFEKIDNANIETKYKNQLKLFHSQNLNIFGCSFLSKEINKLKIQMALNVAINLTKANSRIEVITSIILNSMKFAKEVYEYATSMDDSFLQIKALNGLSRYFLNYQFNLMMLNVNNILVETDLTQLVFKENLNYALNAYVLAIDNNLFDEAHSALNCAYDMKMIYKMQYNINIGEDSLTKIEVMMREIERQAGIRQFKSSVEKVYNDLKMPKSTPDSLLETSDTEIEQMALLILDADDLPMDRLPNIVHSMKRLRIFQERCNNKDIELLEDNQHLLSKETKYAYKVNCILRSKKYGIETMPSLDINPLLNQFSSLLNEKN